MHRLSQLVLTLCIKSNLWNFAWAATNKYMDLRTLDTFNEVTSENKWHTLDENAFYRQLLASTSGVPNCSAPYYTGQIQQNATAGTFITCVTATDPNNLTITWSIPDTSLQRFVINPQTGDIFTSTNLTREFTVWSQLSRSVLEFLVRATNTLGQTCDSLVRVSIITTPAPQTVISLLNNSALFTAGGGAPRFSQSSYYCSTSSCNSDSNICTITAPGASSYSISSSYDNPYTVSSAGVIGFSGYGRVPSGSNNSFTLQGTNSNGVSTSTTVYIYSSCSYYGSSYGFSNSFCNCGGNIQCVISVANNPQNCAYANFIAPNNAALPPSFSQPSYSFTATTCNAGSTVGFVTASNAPTSYVINGNTNFAINNNGLITTNYLLTPGTQSFMVQATNVYGTTYTAVTVAVACGSGLGGVFGINGANNGVFPPIGLGSTGYGAPIFSQSAYSVAITNCGIGSVVGTLSVTNANTFAIISSGGTGSGYGINYNGTITVVQTPTLGATQSLLVQAFNAMGSAFASVSITANCIGGFPYTTGSNIPPTSNGAVASAGTATGPGGGGFSTTSYTFTISSCNPGATVGTVSAGSGATYSITGGGSGFFVDPASGVIRVTGPVTANTQAFLVQATTGTGNSFATVTVTAACNGSPAPPLISSGSSVVPAIGVLPVFPMGSSGGTFSQPFYTFYPTSCGPGVIAGTVAAFGSNIRYTSNGLPYWSIDPLTGVISSTTSVPRYSTFVVTAQSSTGTATVTVSTISTCPEYYSYTVTSCQNNSVLVPPGAIGGIAAQGISSYVLSGPRSTVLAFDPRTGQIISTGDLFSGTYAYVLTANLVQGDTYTAYISLLVFCGGTSVAFTMPTYSFTVSCSPLPQRVGIVLAQASNQESMTYSLGAINNYFYIDSSSGEIRTQQALRQTAKHAFTVSALGASGATATATVNVSVSGGCPY